MIEAIFVVISLKMGASAVSEAPQFEPISISTASLDRMPEHERADVDGLIAQASPQVPWGVDIPGMPGTALDNGNWPLENGNWPLENGNWPL